MKMRYISLILLLCVLFSGCAASSIGTAPIVEEASSLVTVQHYPYSIALGFDEGVRGLNIYTEASGGGLSYHMKADGGSFDYHNGDLFECTISGGEMAGWHPDSFPYVPGSTYIPAYIDVTIQEGERIVGYALITLRSDEYQLWSPTLIKCVTFSDGEGGYASVSAEEVQKRLEQTRKEFER